MVRPRRDSIRPNPGRPIKPIDWALVDELLMAGCTGPEIAPHFDMHPTTFYERVSLEKGMNFTNYSQDKKCKGDSILKHAQYKYAAKGNVPLLMFLGKVRLAQRELAEGAVPTEHLTQHLELLKQLDALQKAVNNDQADPVQQV